MILALKLLLTPFFIAAVSLAGRKWGPTVSGLLMGLPLTSGPVSLILALQQGPAFAMKAGVGSILGQASVCFFCLAYALLSRRLKWLPTTLISIAAFLAFTELWNLLSLSLLPAFFAIILILLAILQIIPDPPGPLPAIKPAAWDLPARMVLAAAFVVAITSLADALGPQLSGLLSPFPIFGMVIAAFTHAQQGPDAVAKLERGVVLGSWSFALFFLAVSGLIPSLGIGWTYLIAAFGAVGWNVISLAWTSRIINTGGTPKVL